jgi:hypothetical protein
MLPQTRDEGGFDFEDGQGGGGHGASPFRNPIFFQAKAEMPPAKLFTGYSPRKDFGE